MTDASGVPTSPDNIPTYNTSADPPSGLGFNTAMAQIQAIITNLKAGTLASGKILASALTGVIPTANLGSGTANSGTFLRGDQTWAANTNGMTLIDDLVVSGSVLASYDTNARLGGNIPATFKHLKLIVSAQSDALGNYTLLQFNGDTSVANYESGQSAFNGTARSDSFTATGSQSALFAGFTPGTGETTKWSSTEITIPNYANATNTKTFHSICSAWQQGVKYNGTFAGDWLGTAAITRIVATLGGGGNFKIGSRISLYGIS